MHDMRVLFATDHVHYPQGAGGLERNTHELCLRLKTCGLQPAVMCSLKPDLSVLAYRNRLLRRLARDCRFPRDNGAGYPVFRGWREGAGAAEVAERFRPDVVVVQCAEMLPLARAFSDLRLPVLAYFHEVARVGEAPDLAALPGVWLLANSAFTAGQIEEKTGVAPEIVRPLVDPSFYHSRREPHYVLFVNAVPRKGLEIALGLAAARPDIPFLFVLGWVLTKPERRALKTRAAALGNVRLHSPTNDMAQLYVGARLLIAPSQLDEAWGRVATEAHIAGIPVLASRRAGLPESVGPGGLLVDPAAPMSDWVEALGRLWDEGETYRLFCRQALDYARRSEIAPETIVRTLVEQLAQAVGAQKMVRFLDKASASASAPQS
jgi:glycosyltransferase involved in cell wall biosynthesis